MKKHKETASVWRGMIQRCTNPDHVYAKYYSEKGVTLDKAWFEY